MPKLYKPPTFFFLNRPISSPVCVDENQRVAAEWLIISRKPLRVSSFSPCSIRVRLILPLGPASQSPNYRKSARFSTEQRLI